MTEMEIRLLTGPHAGARGPLDPSQASWTLGSSSRCDIVIRDTAAPGLCCRLDPLEGMVKATVLEGEIEILGVVVSAPGQAIIATYMPFRVGATWLAIGTVTDEARWADATAIVVRSFDPASEGVPSIAGNDDIAVPAAALPRRIGWRMVGVAMVVIGTATALAAISQDDFTDISARANPVATLSNPGGHDRHPSQLPDDPNDAPAPAALPFSEKEKIVAIVLGKSKFIMTSTGKRYEEGTEISEGVKITSIQNNSIIIVNNGYSQLISI